MFKIKISIQYAIKIIEQKQKENLERFSSRHDEAINLLATGSFDEALNILNNNDELGFVSVFNKAFKYEKSGNLIGAFKIYWKSIIENGTDASANFKRLMILLNKLNLPMEELKVAKI